MCLVHDQCILCVSSHKEIIRIFSSRGRELKIAEILADHFWFRVEDFNDQPNGICSECWKKTEEFDEFFKSVQAAHLTLLSTKYKATEVEAIEENVAVKGESVDAIKTSSSKFDHIAGDLASKVEAVDYGQDTDLDPENGFVSEVDVKRTSMKQESPSSSSMLPETKTVVKSAVEKRPRTKRSPPSSPSVKVKKRPATAAALSSKELTNDDNNQYSPLELEMETKMSDYFQMNCDLCMHRFSSWSDARLHYLDRHNVLKPFLRCCNRKYFLRSRIIEHIIWHVDPSSFCCQKCPKKFHEKRTLAAHTLRHLEDEKRSFECVQCHKRFSRQHILNRHLSDVHPIGDQKFICQICKKNFKSEHIMKMHVLKVHERIDQRICDVCAKVFKTKEGFQDHWNTQHMGVDEPRVQCNICGAWLKNRGTLNKHLRIHTDKPQVCDICHKTKPTRTALNHHKRLVHGEAAFPCTICNKTFKRQLSLTEHIAFHTGENLYTCPYCSKMFKSNSNMHKHRKQVHFDKWTADRESKRNALFSNP